MFVNQGSERMLCCDKCRAGVMFVMVRGDNAVRRNARKEGWSTAKGRDLCRSCSKEA